MNTIIELISISKCYVLVAHMYSPLAVINKLCISNQCNMYFVSVIENFHWGFITLHHSKVVTFLHYWSKSLVPQHNV